MKTNLKPSDVTQALVDAVYDFIHKKAVYKTIVLRVNAVKVQILQEIDMYTDLEGCDRECITNPDNYWLCSDEELLQKYYAECDRRLREAGLKPASMDKDFCPALVAETEVTKAEMKILDECAKMMELDCDGKTLSLRLVSCEQGLQRRREFLDNAVGLVITLTQ